MEDGRAVWGRVLEAFAAEKIAFLEGEKRKGYKKYSLEVYTTVEVILFCFCWYLLVFFGGP